MTRLTDFTTALSLFLTSIDPLGAVGDTFDTLFPLFTQSVTCRRHRQLVFEISGRFAKLIVFLVVDWILSDELLKFLDPL